MSDKPLTKVLFVDDDPTLLLGLTRVLRKDYAITTATSGSEGLEILSKATDFAVVVSDMRMPEMSGAQFLAKVRYAAPEAVRMLLTGASDLESAVQAVNSGHIFRFLTKPCEKETLAQALAQGVAQYDLIKSEQVLLEKTLVGSIDALMEVLALSSPKAFGRARRLRRVASALAAELKITPKWPVEAAAMLSQIGWVTLPPETADKLEAGQALNELEIKMVQGLPKVTEKLLAHIPRLEPVREILLGQEARFDEPGRAAATPAGAWVLKLASAYEALRMRGLKYGEAVDHLSQHGTAHDPKVLEALKQLKGLEVENHTRRDVALSQLVTGMVLADAVVSRSGALLIAKGHEVTHSMLERLRNFSVSIGVREPIAVVTGTEADEPMRATA